MQLVENAIKFDELSKKTITESMQELTGLDNPNSVQQLQCWLQTQGIETASLDKKAIKSLIEALDSNESKVREPTPQEATTSAGAIVAQSGSAASDPYSGTAAYSYDHSAADSYLHNYYNHA